MSKLEEIFKSLEGGYSASGIIDWFSRPRVALDGRTPAQAIEDGDLEEVRKLAAALNGGMIAT